MSNSDRADDDGCFRCPNCNGIMHESWDVCGSCPWKPGLVPVEVLKGLASELEELRIKNTEKKQERDAKGDYEGMANYAGKEFAYFRTVENLQEVIEDYE